MSRPICWVCGKQLMYVSGKPVYAVMTDPIGAEHKVHKACAKYERVDADEERRKDFNEFAGIAP